MKTRRNVNQRLRLFARLITVTLGMSGAILGILLFARMDDSVPARGRIEPVEAVELRSPLEGRIARVHAKSGQRMEKDQVILVMDTRGLSEERLKLASRIRELEAQLALEQSRLAVTEKNPLPREYRHARIDLEAGRKRMTRSRARLQRFQKLYERNLIPKREMETVQLAWMRDQTGFEKAAENYRLVEAGLDGVILERGHRQVSLLEVRLKEARRRLAAVERTADDYSIRAPAAGLLIKMDARPGALIKKGQRIADLVIGSGRKVSVLVDERHILKVRRGQRARVISCAEGPYANRVMAGWVDEVSDWPLDEKQGVVCYPVDIHIAVAPTGLRLGSTAEVKIINGRRRILFFLLGM